MHTPLRPIEVQWWCIAWRLAAGGDSWHKIVTLHTTSSPGSLPLSEDGLPSSHLPKLASQRPDHIVTTLALLPTAAVQPGSSPA